MFVSNSRFLLSFIFIDIFWCVIDLWRPMVLRAGWWFTAFVNPTQASANHLFSSTSGFFANFIVIAKSEQCWEWDSHGTNYYPQKCIREVVCWVVRAQAVTNQIHPHFLPRKRKCPETASCNFTFWFHRSLSPANPQSFSTQTYVIAPYANNTCENWK